MWRSRQLQEFPYTIPRLIRGIQGSDDAPNLLETAENVAIAIGGKPRDFIMILIHLIHWVVILCNASF